MEGGSVFGSAEGDEEDDEVGSELLAEDVVVLVDESVEAVFGDSGRGGRASE